ncbi:hypothetical protein CLAIMM_14083 [Cladophialophora immunda]|nr:hypothetical protein CLAIMM_14083 [Cladophialophora immunda]
MMADTTENNRISQQYSRDLNTLLGFGFNPSSEAYCKGRTSSSQMGWNSPTSASTSPPFLQSSGFAPTLGISYPTISALPLVYPFSTVPMGLYALPYPSNTQCYNCGHITGQHTVPYGWSPGFASIYPGTHATSGLDIGQFPLNGRLHPVEVGSIFQEKLKVDDPLEEAWGGIDGARDNPYEPTEDVWGDGATDYSQNVWLYT